MKKRLQRLHQAFKNHRLGKPLIYFDVVGSTNDILKDKAQAGAPEGCLVIADRQTQGRGRLGKEWLSLDGKGVYMSLLLRPQWPASDSALISMLAAVAVARALERIGLSPVHVKWPNDVLVRGKKIAGILTEPRISRPLIDFVVVGVGVNVGHQDGELSPLGEGVATSCLLEGIPISCDDVLIHMLDELEFCYDLAQQGHKDRITEEWANRRIAEEKRLNLDYSPPRLQDTKKLGKMNGARSAMNMNG